MAIDVTPAVLLSFDDWLSYGMKVGYCSQQYCSTHDCGPLHLTEESELEDGYDICMVVVRLGSYQDWAVS
jgi:hypothetical protein